jgi:hypothetical protein
MDRPLSDTLGFLIVHDVEPIEIICDLILGMRDVAGESLGPGNVLGAGDGAHLGAVERHNITAHQGLIPAKGDECRAHPHDRLGIVVPECGDGSIVGPQLPHQPDRLKIATTAALEVARRSHLIEITPDVETEHISRMIAGTAGCRRHRPRKAQIDKIQTIDKGIDDASKTIRRNIIIDAGGKQTRLGSVSSFDEAHSIAPASFCRSHLHHLSTWQFVAY